MKTLDGNERRYLLSKYMKNPEEPLDFEDALEKVNLFHDTLKKLARDLKLKGKSDKDINEIFKEKFYNLIQSLDK